MFVLKTDRSPHFGNFQQCSPIPNKILSMDWNFNPDRWYIVPFTTIPRFHFSVFKSWLFIIIHLLLKISQWAYLLDRKKYLTNSLDILKYWIESTFTWRQFITIDEYSRILFQYPELFGPFDITNFHSHKPNQWNNFSTRVSIIMWQFYNGR